MIKINKIKIHLFKYKNKIPVLSSFGRMTFRSSLIVELIDENDNSGFGEIWCNFPNHAGRYRFEIFKDYFANLLKNFDFEKPSDPYNFFYEKFNSIKIQSGDYGAFSNIISGIDCASWDLFSKNKKTPLNKLINSNSSDRIQVYASGINRDEHKERINEARNLGIKKFKIKIGYDLKDDISSLVSIEKILKDTEDYMIDVNQAWKIDKVSTNIKALNQFRYYWLEEPISADNSLNEIINLINNHKNLAFGENITQTNHFVKLNDTSIKFLQPDIARYGGVSQIISLKDKIVTDKLYLHYLGGAVGLITSAHLMSAINQSGCLEYDINENALRTDILNPTVKIKDGYLLLNSSIGIGFDLSEMSKNYLDQFYELSN